MRTFLALVFLASVFVPDLPASPPDTTVLTVTLKVDTTLSAPVVMEQETLFVIMAGVSGISADQRAKHIEGRIEDLANDSRIPVDSIEAVTSVFSTDIVAGDRFLFSLFDIDGAVHRISRAQLAEQRVATIRAAVSRYREERSKGTLLRGILVSALATVLLWLLLYFLGRGRAWVEQLVGARVEAIAVEAHGFIRVGWLRSALHFLFQLVRWTLVLIVLYGYLDLVLSQFVWTRAIAEHILGLVLDPLRVLATSLVGYLPNLFFLLILILLVHYLLRFLRFLFGEIEKGTLSLPGFYPEWANPTFNLVRVLVVVLALVVAFPYIPGSGSLAFQGVSIFLGLLLSLGSTSAVANIVAGVILTYMRSFKVGDIVRIQETEGTVVGYNLLVTRIRTWKMVEVAIPNATVLSTHVLNYSSQARRGLLIFPTTVTIGYDAPWRQVHAMLLMAAEQTEGVLRTPPPFVLQRSLNDFYVTYELNAYTGTPERMLEIYSDLHKNIQDRFNENGVQIMSPNYMMDRTKPTYVPPEHWYDPPAKKPGEPGADR